MSNGAKEKAPPPGRGNGARTDDITVGEYTPRLDDFLPLVLSDFEAKDNNLTELQHMMCIRLVKQFWLSKRALPLTDVRLARIARVSPTEWRRNRADVLAYFVETPYGLEPEVYREELNRAQQIAEKRRAAGRKGGKISGQKRQAFASETASKGQARRAQAVTVTVTDNSYPSGGPLAPRRPIDDDGQDSELQAVAGGVA